MISNEEVLCQVFGQIIEMDKKNIETEAKHCTCECLTESQRKCLMLIDENQPITISNFAKLLGVTKPTVSELVNRLISNGFIKKESCPNDRRVCYLKTTSLGKKAAHVEESARIKVVKFIQTKFDEVELNQLIALMSKLLDYQED